MLSARSSLVLRGIGFYLAGLTLGLAPFGVITWLSAGHGGSVRALARIHPGTTREQVIDLLGRPGTINRSSDLSETWTYTRFTWCQVKVHLAPEGIVEITDHDH